MDYKERASERVTKFYETHEVDDMGKFFIEEFFKLQEEYKDVPDKETRRKLDLMALLEKIQYSFKGFRISEKVTKPTEQLTILVVGNTYEQVRSMGKFLSDYVISKQDCLEIKDSKDRYVITTKNRISFIFTKKTDSIRGIKIYDYWNLTGDKEYEHTILEPMRIRKLPIDK